MSYLLEATLNYLNEKKKGDGNLANNYPPYDQVTRGDVIAGATGKDQEGGKKKMKEDLDLFDIVMDHLLSNYEGLDEETAMEVMSDLDEEEIAYIEELYQGRHGQTDDQYKNSRSNAGKMISGTSTMSGAAYTSRGVQNTGPNPAGGSEKPQGQGRMTSGQRTEMQYRKANLNK